MKHTIELFLAFTSFAIIIPCFLLAYYLGLHERLTGIKNVGRMPWEKQK